MNSDEAKSGPAANPTPRSESVPNSKSRWRRGPSRANGPGPAGAAAAKASCGIVTDLANARESLSGRLAGGQEATAQTHETKVESREERVEEFRDEVVQDGRGGGSRHEVEEFRDETVREEHPERSRARPERTPKPRTEEFRDEAVNPARERRERLSAVESFRDEARPPERKEERRERPAENERASADGRDGHPRQQYIALKPDPANDPAPRRIRTESAKAPQVVDYLPSRSARVPDKTLPLDGRERERGSASTPRPKAHATIEIGGRASGKEKPSEGLLGMIKRVLGFGKIPDKKEGRTERAAGSSRDEDRSEPDRREGSERSRETSGEGGQRRRRRRRGGRGRHGGGHEQEGHRNHGDI